MKTKQCRTCKKIKSITAFYVQSYGRGNYLECKSCYNKLRATEEYRNKARQYQLKTRIAALNVLGGLYCVHCGYDKDVRALQIDHVQGNGALERKKFRNNALHLKIIKGQVNLKEYQVLCANCNRIKGTSSG